MTTGFRDMKKHFNTMFDDLSTMVTDFKATFATTFAEDAEFERMERQLDATASDATNETIKEEEIRPDGTRIVRTIIRRTTAPAPAATSAPAPAATSATTNPKDK